MTPDQAVLTIAAAGLGLVTREQAHSSGLSAVQIRTRVRSGKWEQLRPGIYRPAGQPGSPLQDLAAAVLATHGAASHRSSGWLMDLFDRRPPRHEITVGLSVGHHHDGVRLHRTDDLLASDVTSIRGVRSTNATRTLIDLGARLEVRELARVVDTALHRKMVHPDRLICRFLQLSGHGRDGIATMRSVLVHVDPAMAPAESDLETLLLCVMSDAGLPTPVRQHPVRIGDRSFRIDVSYPEWRIAIEGDGFTDHGTRRAFESDRERQNLLVNDGWAVLRFTWRQICDQPKYVVDQIARAVHNAERT